MESRTQGSRPRPRTQKKIRGQGQGQPFRGQTLSRPRTGMLEAKAKDQGHKRKCSPKKINKVYTKIFQAISKKKKRSLQKFSKRSPQKNVFQKFFQGLHKILTIKKIVLSLSRGQANFRGLDLRGQGQGLQNLSSRTPPLVLAVKRFLTLSSIPHQSYNLKSPFLITFQSAIFLYFVRIAKHNYKNYFLNPKNYQT